MSTKNFPITVKTLFGFEEVLAQEIKDLGGDDIEILNRAVQFIGDTEMLYKCNLHLRTALRVVKPIRTVRAYNYNQLTRKIKSVDWSEYFNVDQTFAIHATTHSEIFRHSKFAALKTKDAIVDQFRDKFNERPSVDTEDPDISIYVHISDRDCTLSLDSSGDSLDKRGYRLEKNAAPINEVLAGGILKLSGWNPGKNLIDPMCGSGTFPIESAMIASNIAPGSVRRFAFEKWNDFDAKLWARIRKDAKTLEKTPTIKIMAYDIDDEALQFAKQNAKRAGVDKYIKFKREDFFKSEPGLSDGFIIMNPPYGKRISQDEIIEFYKSIGTQLKRSYNGFEAWIISANLDALKFIGLKPSKKTKLFNGSLECRLQKYELYSGSKKASKNPEMSD